MPAQEFVFNLQFSDESAGGAGGGDDQMLTAVATTVLDRMGYAADTIDELVGLVRAVCAECPPRTPCHVRFHAHDGQLNISVAYSGREWETSYAMPEPS